MRFFNSKSIGFRIILCSILCMSFVGILSNYCLYFYTVNIVAKKSADIDELYIETIKNQLNDNFSALNDLCFSIACDNSIAAAMDTSDIHAPGSMRKGITAQQTLNYYLAASNMGKYIRKLMVFNDAGVTVQAEATDAGRMDDYEQILQTPLYKIKDNVSAKTPVLSKSITPFNKQCFALIFPLAKGQSARTPYFYMEIDTTIATDILAPYAILNPIFLTTADGRKIFAENTYLSDTISELDTSSMQDGDLFTQDNQTFRLNVFELKPLDLSICNCFNLTNAAMDKQNILYLTLIILFGAIIVAGVIMLVTFSQITRPIQNLTNRIMAISSNDFSFDPEIEKGENEISHIGKIVNQMTMSISSLLDENNKQNEQKKNIEINLLQAQVNPHFIYNTLDSIHWMAVTQKNHGIMNVTRSFSNLLRNMAKGYSQKITIGEELSLLNDYITIQKIRYLESFDVVNNIDKKYHDYTIVKLTLQPLVENAIFHGIEAAGRYGTIVLDAHEEDEYLVLTVEDDGCGIPPENLQTILKLSATHDRNSMNGIGIGNVHSRLQLVYGEPCGLRIESELGKFTRISVIIRKEMSES